MSSMMIDVNLGDQCSIEAFKSWAGTSSVLLFQSSAQKLIKIFISKARLFAAADAKAALLDMARCVESPEMAVLASITDDTKIDAEADKAKYYSVCAQAEAKSMAKHWKAWQAASAVVTRIEQEMLASSIPCTPETEVWAAK